jgi:hypothetical protein
MWVRGRLTIEGMASCKIEFKKELKRVRGETDFERVCKQGISVGVARRFVSEITQWAKLYASVLQF